MDNCVSTGRVSGLLGAPASVAGLARHHQPFLLPSSNKPQQPTNQCTVNLLARLGT